MSSNEQAQNRVLDQIGEEILRARKAGKIQTAAHFAGMARNVIDPQAPVPQAPEMSEIGSEELAQKWDISL